MSAFLENSGQGTCPYVSSKDNITRCNKECEKWRTVKFNNGKEVSACSDNWSAFFLEYLFNFGLKADMEKMKKEGKREESNILIPELRANIKTR